MKKIKSISGLQDAKRQILQRQADAEFAIRSNWKELKDDLNPRNMINETLSEAIIDKTESVLSGDSVLKNTLMYGLTLLAKKVTDKAEEKASQFFKKKP
ncbi:hypothetical protein EMGBS15_10600 [Filimonas sp.]|nr:hypothetical protein EMGBS15_10600 [Filimonas sp.]